MGNFEELQKYLKGAGRAGSANDRRIAIAEDPVLTGVQVIFRTGNEDKDADTWLECWISKSGEYEAAYANTYGYFPDGSQVDLFLQPKSNLMRKSEIPGSWLQIRIKPD